MTTTILRRPGVAIGTFACLLLAGCGPRLPPFTEVEGTVSIDNQPLPCAQVEFVPELTGFGAGYNSTAITDEQGHFQLTSSFKQTPGALLARHHVLVREQSVPEKYRERTEENAQAQRQLRAGLTNRPIPREYANFSKTPLVVEVTAEQKTYDLHLIRKGSSR